MYEKEHIITEIWRKDHEHTIVYIIIIWFIHIITKIRFTIDATSITVLYYLNISFNVFYII